MLDQYYGDSKNSFTVESDEDKMKTRTDNINLPPWDGTNIIFFPVTQANFLNNSEKFQ